MGRAIAKNQHECIACGLCVELCPAVFAQGEDKPIIATPQMSPDDETCAQEAIDSYPVSCIH